MSARQIFELRPDRKGATWDLLLYVPTVALLASMAAALWFSQSQSLAYLMAFLASFFLIVGANRVLKTRLMLLPAAPVGIVVDGDCISIRQRDGATTDLVKNPRVYADLAGRSFGLAGLNREGQRLQFVFHRGQFRDEAAFAAARESIGRLQRATAGAGAK